MTASKLQQGDIKHTGYVLRIRNITFWSALLSYIVYTIYVSAAYHRDTCIPVLSTKQVRLMNMSSLGYKYFLLLLSKFILPNSSSLCRCLIFATFLALCLYCDFLSIPLSFLPNRSDNEPDGLFFLSSCDIDFAMFTICKPLSLCNDENFPYNI